MPLRHRLLAVSVAIIWGLNFIATDVALDQFPPMFLVALRFALLAVPTLLFVPRPRVPLRWLLGYGFGFGILQFVFLYWAMSSGMPPGMASILLQASAPFTVLLGATFLAERVTGRQLAGLLLAVAGVAVVGWYRAENAAVLPFLLTLAGALGWAIGTVCNRQAKAPNPLHLTMWMSVVPPLPMLGLSLLVEGPARIGASFQGLTSPAGLVALAGLAYTVLIATVVGSGIWTTLLAQHPAGVVAQYSMLVPVVGMGAAWLLLGESVSLTEICGGVMIVGGVLFGSLRRRPAPTPELPPAIATAPAPG